MSLTKPAVDYRQLRPHNLTELRYRHLCWLLFWPVFGLIFSYLELGHPGAVYHPMHCWLDDRIPFWEWFLLPYVFWYVYLLGMHLYTLFHDLTAFRKLMLFLVLTYGMTLVIYCLYPTCQQLRPDPLPRDNLLTRGVALIYANDTNTNVCPSLHVAGALAVTCTGLHCPGLQKTGWKWFFLLNGVLISLSTVFMKQHSVLDILAALPICAIAYLICWPPRRSPDRAGWLPRAGR